MRWGYIAQAVVIPTVGRLIFLTFNRRTVFLILCKKFRRHATFFGRPVDSSRTIIIVSSDLDSGGPLKNDRTWARSEKRKDSQEWLFWIVFLSKGNDRIPILTFYYRITAFGQKIVHTPRFFWAWFIPCQFIGLWTGRSSKFRIEYDSQPIERKRRRKSTPGPNPLIFAKKKKGFGKTISSFQNRLL